MTPAPRRDKFPHMGDSAPTTRNTPISKKKRIPLGAFTALIAAAIFFFAYSSIKESREDKFTLLRNQSRTLLQTLVESANNAITANRYYWEAFISRISPVAQSSFSGADAESTLAGFAERAEDITIIAVYQFDDRLSLLSSALNPDASGGSDPQEVIYDAASALLADSSLFQSLVFMPDTSEQTASALYLEIDSTRTLGVCLLVEFPGLWEMESDVGIGPLIQRLGESDNVSYILFQDSDGLIFSSTALDSIESFATDTFLGESFEADTICSRLHVFEGVETLELVAPFSSGLYPDGLFRLGISLSIYKQENAEFTRQVIYFGLILFLLAGILPLYFGTRRERRQLGLSLAREQSISESVLNSMRSGVVVLDHNGIVQVANQRLNELFELNDEMVIQKPARETSLARLLPAGVLESAQADSGEFDSTINGERRFFLFSATPVAFESDKTGRAIVIHDYTRQRALEEESARRERLAELGDLAAGVAHEVRNPLNAISLAAQRLDAEFSEQISTERENFSFFTTQIKNETRRLDEIVTRLLGLTRAPKDQSEPVAVAPIINDWAAFLRPEVERDRVTLKLDLDENAKAKVDRDKLRQTLGNLYRNSVEAFLTESDQTLTISIELKTSETGSEVYFTDNGPGVSQEIAAKLFTPYFTTKDDGSGLGLAISYRLVSDMGGELALDDSYVDGARFTITLPG